jgi:NitT/TauT family transport system permease protein
VNTRTERWRQAGLIVAGLGGFLLLWEFLVRWLAIKPYILPAPSAIPAEMAKRWPTVVSGTLYTGEAMLVGFAVAVVIGVALAVVVAFSRRLEALVYPVVLFLQIVPKIAVAPLFLVWLGFGIESKVLLTILMTFFPLLLASISGFMILDDRLLFLTQSMGASRWDTFRYLRFPAALPVIFSGIKTSATIAATAAIVAEFVGANKGLGYVLLRGTSTMDIELVFAVLVVLTVVGIAINYFVELCEWAMTPWQRAKYN